MKTGTNRRELDSKQLTNSGISANYIHSVDSTLQDSTLQVNKLAFFGVELDVITGHPEHELLFVASQVAAAAGLNAQATCNVRKTGRIKGLKLKDLGALPIKLIDSQGRELSRQAWLFAESTVYLMLLRGHAPQSEPFRKWVTEEVLPSIRKSGTYDLAKSGTPEGQQFADELGALRAALQQTTARLESLEATIALLPE